MKIIVSHVYSNGNKGDAALLSVLLSDIKKVFSSADITILTFDDIEKKETFEGVPLQNGFMYYAGGRFKNIVLKSISSVFVVTVTLIWALIYRYTKKSIVLPKKLNQLVSLYRDADLIVPVGGGYIRARANFTETVVLFFQLYPFLFSRILGKVTINYAQSIGPFGNSFQEKMARFALDKVNGIIVRESITMDMLKNWNITPPVCLSVDSGFSFDSKEQNNIREKLGVPHNQMLVGVTVRTWLKSSAQEAYEKTMAQLCDQIIETYDARIVFIPQVTVAQRNDDDRESGNRTVGFMKNKKNVLVIQDQYTHHVIKSMYSGLDYLIGTRFHSVIFAITSYVPSIAVGYEHKTLGIMTDIGLQDWVVDIKKTDPGVLFNLFKKLVQERDGYLSHLHAVLPAYIAHSDESMLFVKKIYNQY